MRILSLVHPIFGVFIPHFGAISSFFVVLTVSSSYVFIYSEFFSIFNPVLFRILLNGGERPTLRKRWRRYQALGEDGLINQSRRPKHSPNQKVFNQQEDWILNLRRERNLGVRRVQHELKRLYACALSLDTIQKVLTRH